MATAAQSGSQGPAQPRSCSGLFSTSAPLATGTEPGARRGAALPLPLHTCALHLVTPCTHAGHLSSLLTHRPCHPLHTHVAVNSHHFPCAHMCVVSSLPSHARALSWSSHTPLRPQGHRAVVRGQRRLGGGAAALAAPEPAPLQRALRPPQGLVPARPGAPQPGRALLPGQRVSEALQDAQGGPRRAEGAAGTSPAALLTASLPSRLWTRWPEAGPSATRMRWTGPTPHTHR